MEAWRKELYLAHHGIKGQKWGVRRGPPYPIGSQNASVDKSSKIGKITNEVVKRALESGEVSSEINPDKQKRHLRDGHPQGRSYIDGDLEYAQRLVDQLSGTGDPVTDGNGKWSNKERVVSPHIIGTYVDFNGVATKTNRAMIVYSKTGSHIYPRKKGDNETSS